MDDVNIFLQNRSKWSKCNSATVRGHAFHSNKLLNSSQLATKIDKIQNKYELKRFVSNLKGHFAIILQNNEGITIISDHIRSYPLYYCAVGNELSISDSSNWINDNFSQQEYDPLAATEYLFSGYVAGHDTLKPDIKQIMTGEIIHFKSSCVESAEHTHHFTFEPGMRGYEPDMEEIDAVVCNAFKRLVEYADGRTILLSLTGGYDSRLIALMLSRLEYENVITYTHDLPTGPSDDIPIAKIVANELGFKHITVELTHSDFRDFYNSDDWAALHKSVGYLDALPYLHETVALKKIRKREAGPEDAILVRGHLPPNLDPKTPVGAYSDQLISIKKYINELLETHYSYWRVGEKNTSDHKEIHSYLRKRILQQLPISESGTTDYAPVTEITHSTGLWYWKERSPKLLHLNYECDFVGYDRWLPLWDREYANFWEQVDYSTVMTKQHHINYVEWLDHKIRGRIEPIRSLPQKNQSCSYKLAQSIVNAFPDGISSEIKRYAWEYRKRKSDTYDNQPIFGTVPRDEFEKYTLSPSHPISFQYLVLYNDGYFDMPVFTLLDDAVPDK